MRSARALALLVLSAALLLVIAPAGAVAAKVKDPLRAGVGQADITPPQMGYYLGGWTRADRVATGEHTRLYAKAMILQRGSQKVALVAADLFAIPGGLLEAVADRVKDLGLDERTILLGATHTHNGPGGFANYPTYNTAAPSVSTISDPSTFIELLDPLPADRQLYTFLVDRIATAIQRAAQDVGPAAAGWGRTELYGLTQNRSIEAFLANYGIKEDLGQGKPSQDPKGADDTIDPDVDVLRVDKIVHRRHVPIGAWSNFADHGTVTKSIFEAYNGDHHSSAHLVLEQRIRKAGKVPSSQPVIDVYGNSDEGDQTAGIAHDGPAGADEVGRVEAGKMFEAWRTAGKAMSRTPDLGVRWTRQCFCGRATEGGSVAAKPVAGLPFFTGSEEERGPLFDITRVPFEGVRSPISTADQGDKIQIPAGTFPTAVPLMTVRVGDRIIASVPGEPTKMVGSWIKDAVLKTAGADGVKQVVIAGLANEYIQYVTTPAEYERQHYEGGSTIFGPLEAPFLRDRIVDLVKALVSGGPAPDAYALDATNGVRPDGAPYPPGAASGTITEQPAARVERLGRIGLKWTGGPDGHDRPLDNAFVTAERKVRGAWVAYDSDLGLAMLWRVDKAGHYSAEWEVPRDAPLGTYRLVVTATRYRLESDPFSVGVSTALKVVRVAAGDGRYAVRMDYPRAVVNVDLTYRPASASGGAVTFVVDGKPKTVRAKRGTTFSIAVPASAKVDVPAMAAQDRFGNLNADGVSGSEG